MDKVNQEDEKMLADIHAQCSKNKRLVIEGIRFYMHVPTREATFDLCVAVTVANGSFTAEYRRDREFPLIEQIHEASGWAVRIWKRSSLEQVDADVHGGRILFTDFAERFKGVYEGPGFQTSQIRELAVGDAGTPPRGPTN